MKTGYLTLIFALACAACTPRFYPPKHLSGVLFLETEQFLRVLMNELFQILCGIVHTYHPAFLDIMYMKGTGEIVMNSLAVFLANWIPLIPR